MTHRPILALCIGPLLILLAANATSHAEELVVGIKEAPPFVVRDDEGAWHGLAVELWEYIAEEHGYDFAYQELDLPELFRDAVKMMHLDHPFGDWGRTVTTTAAECMGLETTGRIMPGNPADLMFFTARTWGEFVSRPQQNRLVMRSGRVLDTIRPEYDQLDHLEGMAI